MSQNQNQMTIPNRVSNVKMFNCDIFDGDNDSMNEYMFIINDSLNNKSKNDSKNRSKKKISLNKEESPIKYLTINEEDEYENRNGKLNMSIVDYLKQDDNCLTRRIMKAEEDTIIRMHNPIIQSDKLQNNYLSQNSN